MDKKQQSHQIDCSFMAVMPGVMEVSLEQWNLIRPGYRVTVLYDDIDPSKNILYKFAGCQAAEF